MPECDGQTDGQTYIPPLAIPAVCISRYANALVKIKFLVNGALYGKSYNRLLTVGNRTVAFDWCHFWWPCKFEGHFSLGCHFHVYFLTNYTRYVHSYWNFRKKSHESFQMIRAYVHCRWPWRYFKVIRLFHIKFLVNGALYGKSCYRVLIGNHTVVSIGANFDDLERHLKVISVQVVISASSVAETI